MGDWNIQWFWKDNSTTPKRETKLTFPPQDGFKFERKERRT